MRHQFSDAPTYAPHESIDLNIVVDSIGSEVIKQSEGVEIVFKVDKLPLVMGTISHVESLFSNLIQNAVKYRDKSRPLYIHVGYSDLGEFHRFVVSDNGTGIAQESFGSIFNMFSKINVNHRSGSGIGLAICKKIVELMGGQIWVESKLGTGSSFYFTYPKKINIKRHL